MDSLFPIKINIPDCYSNYNACFILSHEENEVIKVLNRDNKVYNLGKISKNGKFFLIDYVDIE